MRLVLLAAAAMLIAAPAAAQIGTPGPPGPFALDVRGLLTGVPDAPPFYPEVPAATVLPTRGLGVQLGGHLYLMRVGGARLGLGAEFARVSAGTSPSRPVTTPTTLPPPRTIPDVALTLTMMSPQVSLNFGGSTGWSYISAGYGFAEVSTATSGVPTARNEVRDSGRLRNINVGGGARWFFREHLAFSFDIRMYLLGAGASTDDPADRIPTGRLMAAGVGISLR